MTKTFGELGILFPLFEAPIEEASGYCGLARCFACGKIAQHCFKLGIGDQVVVRCPQCEAENGLDAEDGADMECFNCGTTVPFPQQGGRPFFVCYQCLRAGKAALGKDTELGMVTWEQANSGMTHGVPGLDHPDFEMVPIPDEEDAPSVKGQDRWMAARVDRELLFELVRTPGYPTWQGESWQFCCGKPMIYLGVWTQQDFEQHALDGNGRDLFFEMMGIADDQLWMNGKMASAISTYVFRCAVCGGYNGHWDVD